MVKSLRTKIHQTAKSCFRIILLPISSIPPIKTVLRHKLPVFTVSSLLLLATPVGVAQFKDSSSSQPTTPFSELPVNTKDSGTSDENSASNQPSISNSQPNESSGTNTTNNASNTNLSIDAHSSSQQSTPPKLTINGQNIQVPANGSVHKNVQSSNQSVDVRVNNNSSSSTSQSNSLNIQIQSHNTSSGGSDNSSSSDNRDSSRLTPRDRGDY